MSTRLWLSGCSLDAIDSWMGSKDEECLSQILAYAEQYLDGKNDEDIELLESVKQLITELVFTDREQCCHDPDCGEEHAHDEHSHGKDAENDDSDAPDDEEQEDEGEEAEEDSDDDSEEESDEGSDEDDEEGDDEPGETETLAEVTAAYILARCASTTCWPEGNDEQEWSYAEIADLESQLGPRFGEDLIWLHFILGGRSLFDLDFDPQVGFCSFFSNEQVVLFKEALLRVRAECAEIVDQGRLNEQDFDSDMVDTMQYLADDLAVLEEAGHDLFIYVS
ncbi:MAG: hypothetical protein IPO31_17940 [Candidatus Obscuribacter sp.]|nr:hypothetical protein [Candidatus Obscuribacter sp.]